MAEVLAQYDEERIINGGVAYRVQACGAPMDHSLWEGWLEFIPIAGGTAVRTPRETTQPNRTDTVYWAGGLTTVYFEGALSRALTSQTERAAAGIQQAVRIE